MSSQFPGTFALALGGWRARVPGSSGPVLRGALGRRRGWVTCAFMGFVASPWDVSGFRGSALNPVPPFTEPNTDHDSFRSVNPALPRECAYLENKVQRTYQRDLHLRCLAT